MQGTGGSCEVAVRCWAIWLLEGAPRVCHLLPDLRMRWACALVYAPTPPIPTCCTVPVQAQSSLGPDYALVPAEARRRHADGAPGLFAACRVLLLVPPPARGGHAPSARNLRLQVEQMVRAEGGAVAHSLAEGRSSPSPSPEGAATLLVCVGQGRDEMQAGLKLAKVGGPLGGGGARGWVPRAALLAWAAGAELQASEQPAASDATLLLQPKRRSATRGARCTT